MPVDQRCTRILLIEDNRADALLIRAMLDEAPGDTFDLEWVERLAAGLQRCAEGGVQAVLLDLSLPDSQGLETLARLRAHVPEVPIVVLTGLEDEALGVKAVQEGAQDYLAKGQVNSALLRRSLRYAVERQRAARAEAEAEARYRSLVESAPDAIVTGDCDGRIVLVNVQAEQLFGYPRHEIIGQPVEMLLPEWLRERHVQYRADYYAAPSIRPMDSGVEFTCRRKDGSEFSADISLSPSPTEAGLLVTCIIRDITERKRAEAERAQLIREQAARAESEAARQRLAFLAEASAVLASSLEYETTLHRVARLVVPTLADYCVIDLVEQDGQVRRVEMAHADPAREKLLLEELRTYRPGPDSRSPVARVLRTGEPEVFPEVPDWLVEASAEDTEHAGIVHALGARSAIIVPLIARGHTLGAITFTAAESGRRYGPSELALAVDLAQRCALAIDNARLYRQLEQNLRTRDDFLASASHDLKTPLTTIKGYAQLVQRQVARASLPDASRLAEGLGRIDAATTRMTVLIDELLDVARLQMGQLLPLERRTTDLLALVQQAVAEHQHTTDRHQLRAEAAAPELVGQWDGARLERVLGNLVNNAIKYSPEGGKITVRVAREGPWAVLQVVDQGIGIPAADLSRIFERFQRAGNVIGRIAGTGIGLAGARQIVEQHGGHIAVESQEGVGTTVTVRLPLVLEPVRSPQSAVGSRQ